MKILSEEKAKAAEFLRKLADLLEEYGADIAKDEWGESPVVIVGSDVVALDGNPINILRDVAENLDQGVSEIEVMANKEEAEDYLNGGGSVGHPARPTAMDKIKAIFGWGGK